MEEKVVKRLSEIEEKFKVLQKAREDLIAQIKKLQAQDQEIVTQQVELRGEYSGLQKLFGQAIPASNLESKVKTS